MRTENITTTGPVIYTLRRWGPVTRLLLSAVLLFLFALPAAANRLCTSGFETNNVTETEWNSHNVWTIQTSVVHSGTYAGQSNTSSSQRYVRCNLTASVTSGTYYARFYFRRASGTGRVASVASSSDATSFVIAVNGSNQLTLTNTADSSAITGATISVDTWYRVEYRVVVSDTVGELELFIDGVSQGTLTGKDTLPTNVIRFYFGNQGVANTANFYYDDIAVNDGNGTFQNGLPGAGKIALITAASDTSVAFTQTGANCASSTNTNCVDDVPGTPDDLNGYNKSTTNGQTDKFAVTALPSEVPANADMKLLHLFWRAGGQSNTGTNTGALSVWDEGDNQTANSNQSTCDVNGWVGPQTGTNPAWQTLVFDLGSRSKADVNSFSIGYRVGTLDATGSCNVTALWANVEWVEAAARPVRRPPIIYGAGLLPLAMQP